MQNSILKKWPNLRILQESGLPIFPSCLVDSNQDIKKQIVKFQKQNEELEYLLIRYDDNGNKIAKSSSPILYIKDTQEIQQYIIEGITQGYYPIITGAIKKEEHLLAVNILIVSERELIFEVVFNATASDLSKGKISPDIILRNRYNFEVIKGDLAMLDDKLINKIKVYAEKYIANHQNIINKTISFIVSQKLQIFCTNLYGTNCWE